MEVISDEEILSIIANVGCCNGYGTSLDAHHIGAGAPTTNEHEEHRGMYYGGGVERTSCLYMEKGAAV